MSDPTKLSVVIPTFNRCHSLRRTLEGLARQTYPIDQFEVVVISDGSDDGTMAMLADYATFAPFTLRAVEQTNSGPSAARNRGVHEARHEIIVFLDDDVEPLPDFLARHAAHHAEDEKIVVLGPMSPDPAQRGGEPVWIAWEHAKLQQTYNLFRPGGEYADSLAGPMHFYSGNASVRRQWLEAVGGFDETFKRQEDVELAERMARQCGVRFRFDFAADGLHRPIRTFGAWQRIPTSYGALDAQRVKAGSLQVEAVSVKRHAATRLLTRLCVMAPAVIPLISVLSRVGAAILWRIGRRRSAIALLSGLYNACYSQAFHETLFGRPLRKTKRSELGVSN